MSAFSPKTYERLTAALLVFATSGAALAVGVYVASPVLDSGAAQSCPEVRDLDTAIRISRKDPRKVCELSLGSQGHRALPQGIAALTELQYVDATNNKLETLPPEIKSWGKLKRLDLRLNKLRTLPEQIKNLRKIELLQLEQNELRSLPPGFCGVGQDADEQRIELALAKNKLESLPEDFGDCHALRHLDLSDNVLQTLPESFGQLDIYGTLDLRNNELEQLPDSFGQLTLGKEGWPSYIYLDDNKLTDVPVFGPRMHVISLSLRNNRLEHLPRWFFEIPTLPIRYELRSLELSGNPLSEDEVDALKARFAEENAKDSSFTGPEIRFTPTAEEASRSLAQNVARLEQLQSTIPGLREAGRFEVLPSLFQEWFEIAKKLQRRNPGSQTLLEWIEQMKEEERSVQEEWQGLAFEQGWRNLESLAAGVSQLYASGDITTASAKVTDWLAAAQQLHPVTLADTSVLAQWVALMSELGNELTMQSRISALWDDLNAKSAAIAESLEREDAASVQSESVEWLSTADALNQLFSSRSQYRSVQKLLADWQREIQSVAAAMERIAGGEQDAEDTAEESRTEP